MDSAERGADTFPCNQPQHLSTMKTTLLSLIIALTSTCSLTVRAEEEKKDGEKKDRERAEKRETEAKEKKMRMEAGQREFRERMQKQMQEAMQEAARLEGEGKKGEAEARRRQAQERLQESIRNHEREMQEQMQKEMKKPDGGHAPQHQELHAKLKHVEQAMAHLSEAGLPEQAEQLARTAERMRNAIHDGGERPEARRGDAPRGERRPDGETEALRREIQELREAVRQLKEAK